MLQVTETEIKNRLAFDNPWWGELEGIVPSVASMRRRAYCGPFVDLVRDREVNRAVVLMGPRRVGKTVMLQHTVQALLDEGAPRNSIFYVSIDNPVYSDIGLEKMLHMFQDIHGHKRRAEGLTVIFDEVQYLKDWEVHLKTLVDSYPGVKFIASGSAAAALKMKSRESGAGRFTDFLLPPVTFAEFLTFRGAPEDENDVEELNGHFIDYLNFGGFPEAILSERIRRDMRSFVGNDIIDKVLLRDLPSLYGIADPQELNRFFSVLAYNSGNEVSLDELSKSSGVAKNTLRKYLEYLESAFLIHRLYRVDQNAKRFKRATHFKVYLTNPSLRAALFGPVSDDHPHIGHAVETGVMAQLVHTDEVEHFSYARWSGGEVDMVMTDAEGPPSACIEIKWSDKPLRKPISTLKGLLSFARQFPEAEEYVLVKTQHAWMNLEGKKVIIFPVSVWCLALGIELKKDLDAGKHPRRLLPELDLPEPK